MMAIAILGLPHDDQGNFLRNTLTHLDSVKSQDDMLDHLRKADTANKAEEAAEEAALAANKDGKGKKKNKNRKAGSSKPSTTSSSTSPSSSSSKKVLTCKFHTNMTNHDTKDCDALKKAREFLSANVAEESGEEQAMLSQTAFIISPPRT